MWSWEELHLGFCGRVPVYKHSKPHENENLWCGRFKIQQTLTPSSWESFQSTLKSLLSWVQWHHLTWEFLISVEFQHAMTRAEARYDAILPALMASGSESQTDSRQCDSGLRLCAPVMLSERVWNTVHSECFMLPCRVHQNFSNSL